MARSPDRSRTKPAGRIDPISPGTPLHKLLEMIAKAIVEDLADRPLQAPRRRK